MNWLITGASGFIGTYLALKLLQDQTAEHAVLAMDRRPPQVKASHHPRYSFRHADFSCPEDRVYEYRWVWEPDVIVHLAAISGIAECAVKPWESFAVNVATTYSLLEQAARTRVRFIFASSGAVLGGSDAEKPQRECEPPEPKTIYGAQKAAAEALCRGYATAGRVKATALRFSNVYGPYSEHKTSVVHAFMRAMRDGEPLKVHGSGAQRRDFIYVGDLVDAIVAAASSDIALPVINVSSGNAVPIHDPCAEHDITRLTQEAWGGSCQVTHEDTASGVAYSSLDNLLARQQLGWDPKTTLRRGLAMTADWYKYRTEKS